MFTLQLLSLVLPVAAATPMPENLLKPVALRSKAAVSGETPSVQPQRSITAAGSTSMSMPLLHPHPQHSKQHHRKVVVDVTSPYLSPESKEAAEKMAQREHEAVNEMPLLLVANYGILLLRLFRCEMTRAENGAKSSKKGQAQQISKQGRRCTSGACNGHVRA